MVVRRSLTPAVALVCCSAVLHDKCVLVCVVLVVVCEGTGGKEAEDDDLLSLMDKA
jgi:hypothetical protein